jgi:hypothetical protein
METAAENRLEGIELSGMFATFCSYESLFGHNHPQTLRLMWALFWAAIMIGAWDFWARFAAS